MEVASLRPKSSPSLRVMSVSYPMSAALPAAAAPEAARFSPASRLFCPHRKILHPLARYTWAHGDRHKLVESVLRHRNTLAIMPQESARSLCHELSARKMPANTVVISPEPAPPGGKCHFISPERLDDQELLASLGRPRVDLLVIAEDDSTSRSGHDFRPAYFTLHQAVDALGHPPVLALAASANAPVIQDIARELCIPDLQVVSAGLYQPNLHLAVIHVTSPEEKLAHMLRIVRENHGPGIVYAATSKAVEQVHQALLAAGESAACLHGHLSAAQRKTRQESFRRGDKRILIACNAIEASTGMPNVSFILHFHMPASPDAYYREAELAGRDLGQGRCILLYDLQDKRVQRFFLARRYPDTEEMRDVFGMLQSLAAERSPATFRRLQEELPQISDSKLHIALRLLSDASFIAQDDTLVYRLQKSHAKVKELHGLTQDYQEKNRRDRHALDRMAFYAQTGFCRWKVLLEYFGEPVHWDRCGKCDNCQRPPDAALPTPALRHRQPRPVLTCNPEVRPFSPGAAVRVSRYGEGRVVATWGDKVTILFPSSQTRTFLAAYVQEVDKLGSQDSVR